MSKVILHNLKFIRLFRGMSQWDLAEDTHRSQQVISHYETLRNAVSLETAQKIAKSLKVTIALLTEDLAMILVPKHWEKIYDDLHTRVLIEEVVGYSPKQKAQAYYKILRSKEAA